MDARRASSHLCTARHAHSHRLLHTPRFASGRTRMPWRTGHVPQHSGHLSYCTVERREMAYPHRPAPKEDKPKVLRISLLPKRLSSSPPRVGNAHFSPFFSTQTAPAVRGLARVPSPRHSGAVEAWPRERGRSKSRYV